MTHRLSAIMAAALPMLLAFAPTPHWYQSPDVPWVYVNKDASKIRVYTGTPEDYIELTVECHGTATKDKAFNIIKKYIKRK